MLEKSKKFLCTMSFNFSCVTPIELRPTTSTRSTSLSSKHSRNAPCPTIPVAPKIITFMPPPSRLLPGRTVAKRRQSPPSIRNERRQNSHYRRRQRLHRSVHSIHDHSRTDHDDDESGCRQRRQKRPYAQNPRQDQSDPAKHFHHAEKLQKRPWQSCLLGHRFNRHRQLHSA